MGGSSVDILLLTTSNRMKFQTAALIAFGLVLGTESIALPDGGIQDTEYSVRQCVQDFITCNNPNVQVAPEGSVLAKHSQRSLREECTQTLKSCFNERSLAAMDPQMMAATAANLPSLEMTKTSMKRYASLCTPELMEKSAKHRYWCEDVVPAITSQGYY